MVDVLQDLVENRQVRERQNSDYVNYLRDTAPIDGDRFDASYVVETNKDVPKTLELTEKELRRTKADGSLKQHKLCMSNSMENQPNVRLKQRKIWKTWLLVLHNM